MTGDRLEGDIWPFLDEHAPRLVARYFDVDPFTDASFTGGLFDTWGENDPTRFTSDDIVAVSLLSVDIPGRAAVAIVSDSDSRLQELLNQPGLAPDLKLHTAPVEAVSGGSPAGALWSLLESIPGVGWVTAAKLLARKRPHLLPVYDQVVKAALQPRSGQFWEPLWHELQDPRLVERLEAVRSDAGLADDVSLLRVLDVAIWMRNRGIGAGGSQWGGATPIPFRAAAR